MTRLWIGLIVCVACAAGEDRTSSGGSGNGSSGTRSASSTGVGAGSSVGGGEPDFLGPIQCRTDEDCASAGPRASCAVQLPGGVCNNCDPAIGVCPTGTTCIDFNGNATCTRSCSTEQDCNVAWQCDTTLQQCVLPGCDDCVEPYACVAGSRCYRPSCMPDTPCPSPLECIDLIDICVEP